MYVVDVATKLVQSLALMQVEKFTASHLPHVHACILKKVCTKKNCFLIYSFRHRNVHNIYKFRELF